MLLSIFNLGDGEIFLIVSVALILCVRKWPDICNRLRREIYETFDLLRQGLAEFRKATIDVTKDIRNTMSEDLNNESTKPARKSTFTLPLWVAQGFGVGRIP